MNPEFLKTYNALKNDILRLAYSYTKNLSDAEDITQEVFIKLYKNFSSFKNAEHLKKWCIKTTINQCKNLFFSSWKKKINYITNKEEYPYYDNNNHDDLLDALFKLRKKYRLVIILYYYHGFKINEIAQILNIKESTIKTHLKRARAELKEILKEEHDA